MLVPNVTRATGHGLTLFAWAAVWILVSACGSARATEPLPDGRVWEMVSPPEKNGGYIISGGRWGGGGIAQAAVNGNSITYLAASSFAEPRGASANQYLSTRFSGDWATQNVTTPAISGTNGTAGKGTPYKAFSTDLSLGLVWNGFPTASEAPVENPPLAGAPLGYQNFYLWNPAENTPQAALLTRPPTRPAQGFYMHFEGASPDLKHVVVSSDSALTPEAIEEGFVPNLYEGGDGTLRAVNVLPEADGGKMVPESVLGSGNGESDTVSNDGARVFWSHESGGVSSLYVREEGTKTVQLDASQGGASLPGEIRKTLFQTASSDGSRAFFTSQAPLTSNARTGPPPPPLSSRGGNDLYEFDVPDETLRDLSVDPNPADPNGAEVQGVVGASEDGAYVYFVAARALAGANLEGRSPSSGDNLYLWHEAVGKPPLTFIASLAGDDRSDWSPQVLLRSSRVTPSGHTIAFMSDAHLTEYDNMDSATNLPDEEVYLYNATSERLSCASCNPSGVRPSGASSIPGGTPFEVRAHSGATYQPRTLSEDGSRAFFDSTDALVPQATHGAQNVYEYEHGHVYLLSGGTGEEGAEFVDASANGNDVFFLTREQLVPGDTDQLVDLYDARAPHEPGEQVAFPEPPPPPPCEGEGCKPASSPQLLFSPSGSAVFKGAGNIPPPAPTPVTKVKAKKKPKPRPKAKHRRARRSRMASRR
jgi:hypothetical protein